MASPKYMGRRAGIVVSSTELNDCLDRAMKFLLELLTQIINVFHPSETVILVLHSDHPIITLPRRLVSMARSQNRTEMPYPFDRIGEAAPFRG
jgi:hypothetical protein